MVSGSARGIGRQVNGHDLRLMTPSEDSSAVSWATVDELVCASLDAGHFAGVELLVSRGDTVLYHKTFGMADLEHETPLPAQGLFRIMSMTKPILATALLTLVEEGRVSLSDRVAVYLPQFANVRVAAHDESADGAEATVAASRLITLFDLLTHTSGVTNALPAKLEAKRLGLRPNETLGDYVPRLSTIPLDFHPGDRWAYSGAAGFDILARVIELVTGSWLNEFLQARILDPLEMSDTTFHPSEGAIVPTLYARAADGGLRPMPNPPYVNGSYLSGGGGLFSTAGDYLRFARMLSSGGTGRRGRVLSAELVRTMTSPVIPDTYPGRRPGDAFGLGLRTVTESARADGSLRAGSFGWSGAFGTHFWVDPSTDTVAVVMMQSANRSHQDFLRTLELLVTELAGEPD